MEHTVDWVASGHVNPVQQQGSCGSCWAFASLAVIESLNSINNGQLVKLSEQQLVDCAEHANGCDGGNYPPAFYYALHNPVQLEKDYEYVGRV